MNLEIISISGGDEVIDMQVWLIDENRLVDTFDISISYDDIRFDETTMQLDKTHLSMLLSDRIRRIQILQQVEEGLIVPFVEKPLRETHNKAFGKGIELWAIESEMRNKTNETD